MPPSTAGGVALTIWPNFGTRPSRIATIAATKYAAVE